MFSHQFDDSWSATAQPTPFHGKLEPGDPDIAALLWHSEFGASGELDSAIVADARSAKGAIFHERVFPIVPLYVTSVCSEHCTYCNYRAENTTADIERLRLSDSDLLREAEFLIVEKGLRVIELVYATDPRVRVDAICRHIGIVRDLLERHGGGMVGINCEAFDVGDYRRMRSAGLEFAVLWIETYNRDRYREVHSGTTKKTKFEYRLNGYERMIEGGLANFGMGVLSGLSDWRRDWAMLMRHEAYLSRHYGTGAAILGIPRLKVAAGATLTRTPHVPTAEEFIAAVALHNVFSPATLPFVSTREEWDICLRLAAGGGCLFTFNCMTIPGGYSLGHAGYQFPTYTFDAPVYVPKLREAGFTPQFNWRGEVFDSVRLLESSNA